MKLMLEESAARGEVKRKCDSVIEGKKIEGKGFCPCNFFLLLSPLSHRLSVLAREKMRRSGSRA